MGMIKSILILIVVGAFFAGTLFSQPAHADHNDALFFNAFDNLIATMGAFNTLLTTVLDAIIVELDDLQTQIDGIGPHTVDTNAGTICATGELLDGDGNCIPIPADGADGADGSDGISPLTSIRVTTTEPEFLLPTDETVIGVAPTSHIFLPLGIPDGKIIVIKNAGCGCILSAQEDDEILNGDIILGFTDAVALQYLNGIWFEIAEYAGLPATP